MKFYKYHALGNDYIVMDPADAGNERPSPVQLICHRHFGVGPMASFWGPLKSAGGDFRSAHLQSGRKRSGKKREWTSYLLRFLWDRGLVHGEPFTIMTLGGRVQSSVHGSGRIVTVEMGQVSFRSGR